MMPGKGRMTNNPQLTSRRYIDVTLVRRLLVVFDAIK